MDKGFAVLEIDPEFKTLIRPYGKMSIFNSK